MDEFRNTEDAAKMTSETAHPAKILYGGGSAECRPSTSNAKMAPEPEQFEAIREYNAAFEHVSPEVILRWAVETYAPRLAMATAFGPEGCLLLSMLAGIDPNTYVFNLDTGYQFQETLATGDRIAREYGITIDYQRPELSVEQFEKAHPHPLYRSDPGRCCHERKIKVFYRAIQGFDAWISGIRRDQSSHRATTPIVGWDRRFGLVKISPLANWSRGDVWERITRDVVPYNPLHDRGYPTVGCWPCTQPTEEGEGERAGRWKGTDKTECGLHLADT